MAAARLGCCLLVWLLFCLPGQLWSEPAPAAPRSPFVQVGRQVSPSVVNIRIVRSVTQGGVDINPMQEMFRKFFPGGEEGSAEKFELPGTGSGFVVSAEGHILTNHHVIAEADAITVRFTGEQREYAAEVLGTDRSTDLALLKIDAGRDLRPLPFGDSEAIEVGDWAIAIGNPFGNLEGSLTVGVVSAKGRSDLVIGGLTPRYQDFIQTDASINFGNSGGPLVDIDGRIIGVNTAINTGGQGIGFAIPSKLAQRIYQQLLQHGKVVRGYLGVRTEETRAADFQAAAGETAAGARVTAVLAETPAAQAGLEEGDLIVEFAGKAISSHQQLQFLIAESPVDEAIPCVLQRDGQVLRTTVTLVEFPDSVTRSSEQQRRLWLGMEVASLSDGSERVTRLKDALGVTATTGVIVVAVQPQGPAADAGIRPGDVLVLINGQDIYDLAAYNRLRTELTGREDPVQILVRTGTVENYVIVHPDRLDLEQ